MKILLLNYEFPPLGGGAGRATYHLAKELARMGHLVHAITPKVAGQKSEETQEGFTLFRVASFRKGIHDCGFRGALSYVLSAALQISKLARQNRYDILHYFFGLPTGFLSLLPGAHQKIPYIVSLRGSDVPHYDVYNRNLEKVHCLLKPLARKIWKRSRKVVAVTNSLKATAHETMPDQEIIVIPNGVDSGLFKPKARSGESRGPLKLVCVSRLVPRKGVQHILEALTDFKDGSMELSIFGAGNYETYLKNRCRELSLDHFVKFHGYAPRSQLSGHLAASDIFILPSLAEAFGNVFAEAMACGLPVIGSNTGGIPDLVGEENGILVTPGDVAEIKEAIRTLRNSKSLREKMGKANRRKIEEHYSWSRITERFLAVYESGMLKGGGAG